MEVGISAASVVVLLVGVVRRRPLSVFVVFFLLIVRPRGRGLVVTRLESKVVVIFTGNLRSEIWPSSSFLFVVRLRR